MTHGTPKLNAALIEAIRALRGVEKTGHNRQGGYDYAKADDVVKATKGPLADNGIVVVPTGSSMEAIVAWDKRANAVPWMVLTRHFSVRHVSGESFEASMTWPFPIRGSDPGKGVAAAETTCYSYYLKTLLDMDRDPQDDIDHDSHDRGGGNPAQSMLPRTSPKGAQWVARIRAIDTQEKFTTAESAVMRFFDLRDSQGDEWLETGFTDADLDAMREALEEKR